MQILIWKSYGTIDVYDASTPDRLQSALERIIAAVKDWGIDDELEQVRELMDAHGGYEQPRLIRAFSVLKSAIQPGSHESFEALEISRLSK